MKELKDWLKQFPTGQIIIIGKTKETITLTANYNGARYSFTL